ncbi:hypothetical protein OIDMADRAFT_47060 [Oidiodendron maius Zn]|uniref:Uncharacterized protein n=1 Tax=Oidiodendron maius (strain Zn) TaxID=913774 RepID=A0A0C3DYK3_OIDMZ|nr:hypothetical protein OIDMADRAFT_47060 [Oidiodendron maius Zn]
MESHERGRFLTSPTGHQLGPDGLGGLAETHETSPFLAAVVGQQPRQQQSGKAADGVEAVFASPDLEKPRKSYATPRAWNWPDISGRVHEFPMSPTISIFPDIVLVLISLLFLCFAIMALCSRNRPTGDDFGAIMEEAMRLGLTIFPIIFAAIVGRALKRIGRYRAERGVRLLTLWPIMNTKTIFDAVFSQWDLRRLTITSVLLGILFALSPVGGQASLRIVYVTNDTSTTPGNLRYMDTGPLGHLYTHSTIVDSNDLEANASGLLSSMSAVYPAALMQAVDTKLSPRDSWGNPKIPRLELLDASLADPDGWIELPYITAVESWSSLFGLPIADLPSDGVTEFTVETTYVVLSTLLVNSTIQPGIIGMRLECPDCVSQDGFNPDGDIRLYQFLGPPCPPVNATELANSNTGAQNLTFTQHTGGGAVVATGQVTQQHVETAIREIANSSTSSPSEAFIANASVLPIIAQTFNGPLPQFVDFKTVDPVGLTQRATILLNTAIQVFLSPWGFAGDLPSSNMSIYGLPHSPADGMNVTIAANNISVDTLYN